MATKKFQELRKASQQYNERNDCTVKALAILADIKYEEAHAMLKPVRKFRKGPYTFQMLNQMRQFGLIVTPWDSPKDKNGRPRIKTVKTAEKHLPRTGRFLIFTRSHALATCGRLVHDWTSGRQHHVETIYCVTKGSTFESKLTLLKEKMMAAKKNPSTKTNTKAKTKTKAKAKPKVKAAKAKAAGMKPKQAVILKVMQKSPAKKWTREELCKSSVCSPAAMTYYIGSVDKDKREHSDKVRYKSLIGLGLVKVEQHDVKGKDVYQYSLTASGKKKKIEASK